MVSLSSVFISYSSNAVGNKNGRERLIKQQILRFNKCRVQSIKTYVSYCRCHFALAKFFLVCIIISLRYNTGALTICTEISVNMFLQIEVVFFRTENRNGINFYHLQNTAKFFAFSKEEAYLALLIIHTNGTENFGRFGKSGKKVIP